MYKINFDSYSLKSYEKEMFDKIFDNPLKYINMTTIMICRDLFISKSSFLRLLKKVKINTSENLKNILIKNLDSKYENFTFKEIINKNIEKNENFINSDFFLKFINKIKKFDYIYLVGSSSNYYLVKIIEIYFRKCKINAIAVDSWEKINVIRNIKKMCIIIFSRSMESEEIKRISKKVIKYNDMKVFAVTENFHNFKNIESLKIASFPQLKKIEKELPFFYHLNIFMIFISGLITFIKKNNINEKVT